MSAYVEQEALTDNGIVFIAITPTFIDGLSANLCGCLASHDSGMSLSLEALVLSNRGPLNVCRFIQQNNCTVLDLDNVFFLKIRLQIGILCAPVLRLHKVTMVRNFWNRNGTDSNRILYLFESP